MKTTFYYLLIALVSLAGVQPASAQQVQWDGWHPLGNNVSVSFAQVPGSTLWTWKFQNNGTTAITYMDFFVTDNTGQHPDTFPGTLKPGQIFGGWAAFTANSPPTILIKTMQTANSSSQPNNAEQQQTNQQQVLQQQIHNIYNVNSGAAANNNSMQWHYTGHPSVPGDTDEDMWIQDGVLYLGYTGGRRSIPLSSIPSMHITTYSDGGITGNIWTAGAPEIAFNTQADKNSFISTIRSLAPNIEIVDDQRP